jgi:outer membrane protein assembly factor BamB
MPKMLLLAAALCLLPAGLRGDDNSTRLLDNWHQWRGPLANGMSPNGDPPIRWDDSTNVKWKTPLPGRGSSTPIIWGKKVFLITAIDTGRQAKPEDLPKVDPKFEKKTKPPTTYYQFVVLCFDRQSGEEIWRTVATEEVPHEGHHPTHSYAAYSPVTDGDNVYVSFGSRGVYCFDLDGRLKWQRSLGKMNSRLGWGEGTSPVLHGDSLILNWDQEADSFMTVLDAKTGEPRWRVDRKEPTSWNTPLVIERGGQTQVVVCGTNRARSYDLKTGKVIWECGGHTVNCIPCPVADEHAIYCMSGYRGSFACALPLDATGDLTDSTKLIWKHTHGTPYVPSPLLFGDRLYFTQANDALLTSLDIKTGQPVLDRVRLPGMRSFYGSPIGVKDRIYLTSREGVTLVLKKSDKLEVLATNKLDDAIDASPAAVGKQLFLRGEKNLYCVEVK